MKIGIDARILQSSLRGMGQYTHYLIKHLLSIDHDNEYILFYNGLRGGSFSFDSGIRNLKQIWCRVPGTALTPLWEKFRFPKIEYLIGAVDVFHNPINFTYTHYSPLPAIAPMVSTFNGMADPLTIVDESYDLTRIDRWYELMAKESRRVIVISKFAKADLLKKASIPEDRIRIVYYGFDESFFHKIEDKVRVEEVQEKYGLAGKKYLFYVGGGEKNKNLSGLLKAFSLIYRENSMKDIYLVLAGKIEIDYQKLIKESEGLGMNHRVIFTDYVGHDDLPFMYNGAEAFVLPTFNEWFGIPVLEAMACGTPVVASKNTGALEVVGSAVLQFDPVDVRNIADCMKKIIENRELRKRMIGDGFKLVKQYTMEKMARETLNVYKDAALNAQQAL